MPRFGERFPSRVVPAQLPLTSQPRAAGVSAVCNPEQMCAETHDVRRSPTQSCRGVLVLQEHGTIQSPLGVMKACFP